MDAFPRRRVANEYSRFGFRHVINRTYALVLLASFACSFYFNFFLICSSRRSAVSHFIPSTRRAFCSLFLCESKYKYPNHFGFISQKYVQKHPNTEFTVVAIGAAHSPVRLYGGKNVESTIFDAIIADEIVASAT